MPVRNGSPEGSYSITGPNYRRARDKGTGKRGQFIRLQCSAGKVMAEAMALALQLISSTRKAMDRSWPSVDG